MKIHKEGYSTIRNEVVFFIIINYIAIMYTNEFISTTILLISVFIFLITLNFFCIPKRKFKRNKDVIYAPCDGKVVVIEETEENEFYKAKKIQISIFMSPLNVHNQLYPISGKIKYKKYHPGKFLVAWDPKASSDNERSSIVIENDKISILCKQIAGALARRIITYSNVKEDIRVADEFGFIKFGSRVDLFLPIGTNISTKLQDTVKGGQSIIATY